jgi:hypothetical protein
MRKFLLALAFALSCVAALAQIERDPAYDIGYLIVTAGPALPMGKFADTNKDNDQAGLAKTGFTIQLHGAYHLSNNFGIKANGFYSRYQVENVFESQAPGVEVDHWQYYGLTAGPLFRIPLSPTVDFDFAPMTGLANVNSYQVKYNNQVVLDKDWALAIPLKFEAALRYLVGGETGSTQLMLGTDYLFMRPKLDPRILNEYRRESVQVMHVVNVFAGVGISF